MAEDIFDDLDLNPLLVTEDNEELEDEPNNGSDDDEEGTQKPKPSTTEVIEVEEEEEPEEEKTKSTQNNSSTDDNQVKAWADFFKEKGLIDEEVQDEELTDFENLFEKLQEQQLKTANALIESYKQQIPKEIRDVIDAWEEGVDKEKLKKLLFNTVEVNDFSKVTQESIAENAELQKSILKEYYKKTTKYSDEKIDKLIKRAEDLEELEQDALGAIDELKELIEKENKEVVEQEKKRNQEILEKNQKAKQELEKYIKENKTFIGNLNVTEKERRELENALLQPVAKDQNGRPVFYLQKLLNENPIEVGVKLNYLAVITKGFTDFSKLVTKTETQVNKKLDALLESKPPKETKGNKPNTNSNWKDNLKHLQ